MKSALPVLMMIARASNGHSLLPSLSLIGSAKTGVRVRASAMSLKAELVILDNCFLYGDDKERGGKSGQKCPDIAMISATLKVTVSSKVNILPFRP